MESFVEGGIFFFRRTVVKQMPEFSNGASPV